MAKTIYEMNLHETLIVDPCLQYKRVPGGWLVVASSWPGGEETHATTFVPYCDEFLKASSVDN